MGKNNVETCAKLWSIIVTQGPKGTMEEDQPNQTKVTNISFQRLPLENPLSDTTEAKIIHQPVEGDQQPGNDVHLRRV